MLASQLAGDAHGRLVAVERIEAGALSEGSDDPVILLVKTASGDEEVGAAGANLRGVILSHSLPHLSHLGKMFSYPASAHLIRKSWQAVLPACFMPNSLFPGFTTGKRASGACFHTASMQGFSHAWEVIRSVAGSGTYCVQSDRHTHPSMLSCFQCWCQACTRSHQYIYPWSTYSSCVPIRCESPAGEGPLCHLRG